MADDFLVGMTGGDFTTTAAGQGSSSNQGAGALGWFDVINQATLDWYRVITHQGGGTYYPGGGGVVVTTTPGQVGLSVSPIMLLLIGGVAYLALSGRRG